MYNLYKLSAIIRKAYTTKMAQKIWTQRHGSNTEIRANECKV